MKTIYLSQSVSEQYDKCLKPMFEMLYEKLPFNIAINEAVELAKKYDDDKAPGFVNGVLNNIAESNGLK